MNRDYQKPDFSKHSFYHVTAARNAPKILTGGFHLDAEQEDGFGSAKGRGVYCAQKVESAANWYTCGYGQRIVLECRIRAGVRICWVDAGYDKKVINRLRKEFGKDILKSPHSFKKYRPRNKQFQKDEVIALVNYFFHERHKRCPLNGKDRNWRNYRREWWKNNFPYLREELLRHNYDGIGDRSFEYWDSDEIVLFNPSDIMAVTGHLLEHNCWDFDQPDFDEKVELLPALNESEINLLAAEDQLAWDELMKEDEDEESPEPETA